MLLDEIAALICTGYFEELRVQFLVDITIVTMEDVLEDMIVNWDRAQLKIFASPSFH